MNATVTLQQLNEIRASRPYAVRDWSGLTLRREFAVGRAGQQNARRGTAGAHLHLLDVETIIAVADASKDGKRIGQVMSVRGCTTGNGQFTGTVVGGTDVHQVTCKRCLARLDRVLEMYELKDGTR